MMEAELKNNILSLKKVNPTLSDEDIRNYFFRLGYEKEIVEKAFALMNPEIVSKVVEQTRAERTIDTELANKADELKSTEIAKKFLQAAGRVDKYSSSVESERIAVSSNTKSDDVGPLSNSERPRVIPPNPYGSEVKFMSEKIVTKTKTDEGVPLNFNSKDNFKMTKKKGHKFAWLLLFLVIVSASAFSYMFFVRDRYFSEIPFESKNVAEFIKSKNGKFTDNTIYIKLETKERDRDSMSYVPSEEWLAKLAKYARDTVRIKDLSEILKGIQQYSLKNKKYPTKLSDLGRPFNDPLGGDYVYSSRIVSKKPQFSLSMKFETKEASLYLGEYKKVEGQNITFNQSDTRSIDPVIIKPSELADAIASGGLADFLFSSSFDSGFLAINISKLLADNLSKKTEISFLGRNADLKFEFDYKDEGGKLLSKFLEVPAFLQDEIKQNEWKQYDPVNDSLKLIGDVSREVVKSGNLDSVGEPVKETNGLSTLFRYDYVLNEKMFFGLYGIFSKNSFLVNNLGLKFADMNESSRRSEFAIFSKYIRENHILRLWVDSKGNMRKIVFEMRLVPQLKEFEDRQILLSVVSDFESAKDDPAGVIDDFVKKIKDTVYSYLK